jgi:hypothetical protein
MQRCKGLTAKNVACARKVPESGNGYCYQHQSYRPIIQLPAVSAVPAVPITQKNRKKIPKKIVKRAGVRSSNRVNNRNVAIIDLCDKTVIDLSNEEETRSDIPTRNGINSDCPICLDDFSDSRVKFVTECNHSYHKVCFMKLHKQECAMCRKKLKIVPQGYKPKPPEVSPIDLLAHLVASGILTPNERFQQLRAIVEQMRTEQRLVY